MIANSINYIIGSLAVTATAISVGISQGKTNHASFTAINIQPQAKDEISNLALMCSALIETAAILGVFMAVLLFMYESPPANDYYNGLAKIGIGLAIISAGFVISLVSGWPAQEACFSTARQPFHAPWIFNFTLIILSVLQTPLILAFIIALFIKTQATAAATLADSLRLIGAGFSIGIGCIGPAIGLAHFGAVACRGVGINRNASARILTFTFISQAIIESPIIFSMVTSLVLLFVVRAPSSEFAGIALLAAGIAIGLGTFGPGLSSARTAAAACHQITLNPDLYGPLSRTSIFAQGVIDTAAIYALLLSLLMIFFV